MVGGVASLAVVVTLVAGCGSGNDDTTSTSAAPTSTAGTGSKPTNVAFLEYTKSDYTGADIKGLTSVVAPGGGSVAEFNSNFDPGKQVQQCQDAIASNRFNAIVIVPIEPATPVACVQAAKAAGLPVATIETAVGKDPYGLKPQVPGVVAVVVSPLQSQIDADAQLIKQACGSAKPCKVVAEVATPNDPFTNQAVAGVAKQLGPDVEIVQKVVSQYDPGSVAKAMPDVLSAHPDVNVLYAASDQSALAAVPALKSAGALGKVKIIGRGGSSEGVAGIKDGSLFGTTGNWPIQYGEFVGKALSEAVAGEPVTGVSLDMLKADSPVIVTKETVDEFTPEWGSRQ